MSLRSRAMAIVKAARLEWRSGTDDDYDALIVDALLSRGLLVDPDYVAALGNIAGELNKNWESTVDERDALLKRLVAVHQVMDDPMRTWPRLYKAWRGDE
jgi:hypothetical protein